MRSEQTSHAALQRMMDGNTDIDAYRGAENALHAVRGGRVLVVEDNRINQQIARELLENAGMHVDVASNGQEAVERVLGYPSLSLCPWDLVLMDLQMPIMDGYSATAAIRCDRRFEKLPILAMTAHVGEHQGQLPGNRRHRRARRPAASGRQRRALSFILTQAELEHEKQRVLSSV